MNFLLILPEHVLFVVGPYVQLKFWFHKFIFMTKIYGKVVTMSNRDVLDTSIAYVTIKIMRVTSVNICLCQQC